MSEGTGDDAIQRFLDAYERLRAQLKAGGHDLETAATQVEFVVNLLAAIPFPKANLAKEYVRVWEYDLTTQQFGLTHDWVTLSTPPRP